MSLCPYQALSRAKETRLLTIQPADFANPIECSLSHVSLLDRPTYEALSYVWNSTNPNKPPLLDLEIEVAVYGHVREAFKKQPYRETQNDPDTASLFYHTGGSHYQQTITCDGIEVTIGGELYSAFKRLRYSEKPRVLWVDALCINQNDLDERKSHVQLMGQIYAHASKVVIWLGEGIPANVPAFEALKAGGLRLAELQKQESDPHIRRAKFMTDPEMRGQHWDGLGDLLRNTWFERVWVIQEIANAQKAEIQIGGTTWPWEFFSTFAYAFRQNDVDVLLQSRGQVTAIALIGLILDLKRTGQPLLDILLDSRHFKSTLPQDKFYGILGLASDVTDDPVPVDYALDASTVFIEFAVSDIRKRQVLDVLYCCAKSRGETVLKLPTWVPDWTQPCHHTPFLFNDHKSRAAADSKIKLRFEEGNRSLFVWGVVVDKIEAVEQLRRIPKEGYGDKAQREFLSVDEPNPRERIKNMWRSSHDDFVKNGVEASRRWYDNAMRIAFPDDVCTTELYEDLWRTFVCNKTRDGITPPSSWSQHFSDFVISIKQSGEEYRDALRESWLKEAQDPYDLRESFGEADPFDRRISMFGEFNLTFGRWCWNRRFYRTVTGRFGWAPDGADAGDEICVFYGGPVPLLLRPDADGHHEVVGDCYLHGFMEGEAMNAAFEEREFHLI